MSRFRTRVVSTILIVAVLACTPTLGQKPAALSANKTTKIEAAIGTLMSDKHIPGLAIAIATDNQLTWQKGYGRADLENSVPTTSATEFRIASVTKPITAVAVMQLAEKGKIDLDAPVQKYAPAFPTKQFPITTRQLLAHLSGVRHYKPGEKEYTTHYQSLTDALSVFKDDPLLHEPETRYTYTTFGYTLLGVVVEGASGMPYADYLRQYIFEPAGMQHTYVDDVFAIIPNRARGYSPRVFGKFDGNFRNSDLMDSSYKTPGGGLVSTAEDLVRFAIAVQSGVLIKRETFAQMSRNQKLRDGKETGYGYGWSIDGIGERKGIVRHGGVQPGATSALYLIPQDRFTVAILTNLEGGGRLGLDGLFAQIVDIVQK